MPVHDVATGEPEPEGSYAVAVPDGGAHDYAPVVLGVPPAAHYTDAHTTASGPVFPTHRYVVHAQEYGCPLFGPLLATTDLTTVD